MKQRHLLGLRDTSADDIKEILDEAKRIKPQITTADSTRKSTLLKGRIITTLFYENSTRTRVSFETAAKLMGADTLSVAAASSSIQKGETLIDTGMTLDSLLTDVVVIRHSMSGAPQLLSRHVRASVINAGDGTNEHPTQALLDMLTIYERYDSFKNLKVVIVGDAKHSRVVRSNLWGLNKLGADVTVVGPQTLLPFNLEKMGCKTTYDLDKALDGANVVMGLRLQLERQQAGLFPSGDEYHRFYGINSKRLLKADSNVMLLHPGPINRGLEVSGEAADGDQSLILEQVTNGVAVRMAILKALCLG